MSILLGNTSISKLEQNRQKRNDGAAKGWKRSGKETKNDPVVSITKGQPKMDLVPFVRPLACKQLVKDDTEQEYIPFLPVLYAQKT
jgi:hypothetical protein